MATVKRLYHLRLSAKDADASEIDASVNAAIVPLHTDPEDLPYINYDPYFMQYQLFGLSWISDPRFDFLYEYDNIPTANLDSDDSDSDSDQSSDSDLEDTSANKEENIKRQVYISLQVDRYCQRGPRSPPFFRKQGQYFNLSDLTSFPKAESAVKMLLSSFLKDKREVNYFVRPYYLYSFVHQAVNMAVRMRRKRKRTEDDDNDIELKSERILWVSLGVVVYHRTSDTSTRDKSERELPDCCSVCQSKLISISKGKKVLSLPCGHLFHNRCFWLATGKQKVRCLLCRSTKFC